MRNCGPVVGCRRTPRRRSATSPGHASRCRHRSPGTCSVSTSTPNYYVAGRWARVTSRCPVHDGVTYYETGRIYESAGDDHAAIGVGRRVDKVHTFRGDDIADRRRTVPVLTARQIGEPVDLADEIARMKATTARAPGFTHLSAPKWCSGPHRGRQALLKSDPQSSPPPSRAPRPSQEGGCNGPVAP